MGRLVILPQGLRRRHWCPAGSGTNGRAALIAEFYLVDRGLRHRLPGFSSMGRPTGQTPDERSIMLFITAGMVVERKPCVRGEKE
jgi:hypothetical protein